MPIKRLFPAGRGVFLAFALTVASLQAATEQEPIGDTKAERTAWMMAERWARPAWPRIV